MRTGVYTLALVLAAALLATGCPRRQRASTEAEATITQEQAMDAIYALPEVAQWSARVRKAGAIPTCDTRLEETDSGGVQPYLFDLAESRGKRKLLWNRFRVDAVTGKISIYQMVTDEFIPIDLWRVKLGQE